MALSQLQCLDDNHVNLRTHESKPEFLYCEDQRLALEALLRDGREAFFKYLEARGLRGFLSDPELETLTGTVQPYDPGTEVFPETAEEDEPPLSLHYWPDLSDTSIPQMDLGWPDSDAYRGVTRTTVYSQPPLDGQAHIKEIVRKTIAQAQKVIAVVMDVFTDVDIFRDLLDAGFKRKVSVYILLERTTLPHFLSMCQRANMHAGHLKHLRVRYTGGVDFYTRSSTKVRGRMGHRFMFIDGDKAVSGSYSFTWMSSRLDRNFITVVTGQAVDAFDRLIRTLYMTSRLVDLRQVTTVPEPELEPLPQPVVVAPLFADLARKLYNPKYALALGNPSSNPSPTPTTSHNSPKKTESQENAEVPDTKTMKRRRAGKEAIQEEPPIHPGLTNLEKICLMSYLPTWPEPDPASDVIGFINIRDASKPTQVHLQRSEMFETSQAIRFSSPISMPKETLPEVAKPRQVAAKHEEMNKLRPAQNKTKVSVVDRAQPTQPNTRPADIQSKAEGPEQNSPASEPKCESYKDTLTIDNRLHSNPHLNAGHNPTPCLNTHALPHSSNKASTPYTGRPSHMNQTVTNNSPELNSLPRSNTKEEEETSSNTQNAHTSHLSGPTESNTRQQIKTVLPRTDSHTEPQNSSEINHNIQIPTVKSNLFPSSTSATCSQSVSPPSFSGNNHVSITTSMTTTAPLSSINPPLTSSSTVSPPIPSSSPSSSFTPTPPIPKPRTIQLVIKDGFTSDGQKLTEFSVIRRHQPSTGPQVAHNEPAVATEVKTKMPEKEPEIVPELQSNNGKCKKGAQKDADNRGNIREDPQQKQSETSQEAKNEEVIGPTDDRARMDLLAGTNLDALPDFLNTDAPEAGSVNSQKIIPKDVDPKILSIDCKVAPLIADVATVQAGTDATERVQTVCEFAEAPNEKNVTQRKTYLPSQLQRPSCCAMTAKGMDVLDTVECLNAPTHIPVTATHKARMSEDVVGLSTRTSTADTRGQQSDPCFTPTYCTDSWPNTAKHNTHTTFQELIPNARVSTHTPENPLCLHFFDTHMPDIRSPTPERELQSLSALVCTPSPDGFLPRLPTPDSQIHSPEPRSHTTGFRTPTSDVSDGYVSPRTNSTLSTTSEEYYECSDTPVLDTVLYQAVYRSHGKTEDHVSFTHSNIPNDATIVTSPAYINYNTCAATIIASDRNTSSSESQSFPRPASVSSLHERKVKMGEEEKTENEENGRDVDEKGKEPSVAEMGGEQDLRGPQRRGSEEAERTADHLKQGKHLTNSVDKNKETQPQAPKRKRVLNQSAAERLVDGRVTPEELTSEEAEAKQVSTGDLKPAEAPSEGERLDKEKAVDKAALGPSGLERRGRRLSSTEPEGQKPPPKPLQGNQQDGASSASRPSRPSRPLSGPRPCGSRQLNKAASKVHHGSFQVLDKASSPCGLPTRPPPAVAAGAAGSAAGRKQAEASNSQQSLPPRQPLAAQGRMKTGQSMNQHPHPKPQASFLHTHSKMLPQLHPHSQNQTVSAQEAQCQEEGKTPVSFPFSKLYGLKTLKDKMSKLPGQSKRDGTSSPVQGHKKTS